MISTRISNSTITKIHSTNPMQYCQLCMHYLDRIGKGLSRYLFRVYETTIFIDRGIDVEHMVILTSSMRHE